MIVPQSRSEGKWRGIQSWLLSFIVHLVFVIVLGLHSLSIQAKNSLWITGELSGEPTDDDEAFAELLSLSSIEPATEIAIEDADSISEDALVSSSFPATAGVVLSISAPELSHSESDSSAIFNISALGTVPQGGLAKLAKVRSDESLRVALDGRKADTKAKLLLKYGGSSQSEAAVQLALAWLIAHQAPDGGWTFAHHHVCHGGCDSPGRMISSRNGATALALLPFLGSGQTHIEGEHRDAIRRGIDYLLEHQQRTTGTMATGSWLEEGGTMYSHCLSSIAICEAYAMTEDSRLREPAQLSLNYLVQTQDMRGGGWRYVPGQFGDTSVVGWAMMALKSGKMGQLEVPEKTLAGVNRFLDSVGSQHGSNYGYINRNLMIDGGRPTTAIGLLCRMYQGTDQTNAALIKGAEQLFHEGPRLYNLYYTYYASQVLRHLGGSNWDQWNNAMRDQLIAQQVGNGHAAGSWPPNPFPEMGGIMGGRLYSTCMAAMILEVYYRHMPLYSEQAMDDDFKL